MFQALSYSGLSENYFFLWMKIIANAQGIDSEFEIWLLGGTTMYLFCLFSLFFVQVCIFSHRWPKPRQVLCDGVMFCVQAALTPMLPGEMENRVQGWRQHPVVLNLIIIWVVTGDDHVGLNLWRTLFFGFCYILFYFRVCSAKLNIRISYILNSTCKFGNRMNAKLYFQYFYLKFFK